MSSEKSPPSVQDIWLDSARHLVSPNFNDRPDGIEPSLLVIHNISLPPDNFGGADVEALFLNKLDWHAHPYYREIEGLQVSAHFYIKRSGQVLQFVPLNRRAWHAGQSVFEGVENCNDYSIGVELEGSDYVPFTPVQYQLLAQLTQELRARYPKIINARITGHSDIAPGRKTDPGPCFDWPLYLSLIGE